MQFIRKSPASVLCLGFLFLFDLSVCESNVGSDTPDSNFGQFDPTAEHNREHLSEDLSGVIDKKPEDMNAYELQFHYFREHDYNGDNHLDGNEIIMSVIHHMQHASKDEKLGLSYSDDQLTQLVDSVMQSQDKDNDGKLSFQEYTANLAQDV